MARHAAQSARLPRTGKARSRPPPPCGPGCCGPGCCGSGCCGPGVRCGVWPGSCGPGVGCGCGAGVGCWLGVVLILGVARCAMALSAASPDTRTSASAQAAIRADVSAGAGRFPALLGVNRCMCPSGLVCLAAILPMLLAILPTCTAIRQRKRHATAYRNCCLFGRGRGVVLSHHLPVGRGPDGTARPSPDQHAHPVAGRLRGGAGGRRSGRRRPR